MTSGGLSLWWGLFAVNSTALGGAEANPARGLTIALVASLTALLRRGHPGWAGTPPPGEGPAVSGVRGN
ncbi:hypothetical protein [Comamonas sp. JC664]|uniref:hypothetical protein n=1 Tax=Comamonas sp. JC664 TaxID=2801917 RepID=UPI00174AC2AE|nr:hypothetical protein [Comamonas sp. JC664]MBL0696149.1 hypothetical protein [Comamonas sp. JC664]GHG65563.1 hypothetical protein GCM10012319_06810 [Comamonas sp. KCTC 72670]